MSIPVTWGAAGAVVTLALAPWLAALGVIAGIVTKCTIEVEIPRILGALDDKPVLTMTYIRR